MLYTLQIYLNLTLHYSSNLFVKLRSKSEILWGHPGAQIKNFWWWGGGIAQNFEIYGAMPPIDGGGQKQFRGAFSAARIAVYILKLAFIAFLNGNFR